MLVDLQITRISRFFTGGILLLTAAHLTCQSFRLFFGHAYLKGLVPLFDFDREHNLPSYYSAFSLAFCAVLLWLISLCLRTNDRRDARYWGGLSALFTFLSVDEAVGLHERLINPLHLALGTSGLLYYAWVIPYGLMALVLAFCLLRFMRRLPAPTRRLFFLAATLYLGGALGLELLGGRYYEAHHGAPDLRYTLLTTVEEFLEMSGITVFIHALLQFLARQAEGFTLRPSASLPTSESPESLRHPKALRGIKG